MEKELNDLCNFINNNAGISLETKIIIMQKLTIYVNSVQEKIISDIIEINKPKRNVFKYFNKKVV